MEDDNDCACGGTCSAEQAAACYRKTLLRLDGPRQMARQAAKIEEDGLADLRQEARRLAALVLADPGRELHRVQLQRLLSQWPVARVEVDSVAPIAKCVPAVGRGSRFYLRNGECVEWETGAPA